jgi:hypothetical protein
MNKKDIIMLILIHGVFILIGTILFVLSFRTFLMKDISVLFYRGVMLLILTCSVMSVALWFYKRSKYGRLFTYRDIVVSISLMFSCNIVFFTLVPVTIDRSVSVFILGQMNKTPSRYYSKQELTSVFEKKYVEAYDGIQKRLDEQMYSGNVAKDGNEYKLTDQGENLVGIFDFIATMFNINNQFIKERNYQP